MADQKLYALVRKANKPREGYTPYSTEVVGSLDLVREIHQMYAEHEGRTDLNPVYDAHWYIAELVPLDESEATR